jgi:autotransporter-associated beta strand protein
MLRILRPLFVLALCASLGAVAATYNWATYTTGDWSDGARWGGTAPTGTDSSDVISFNVNPNGGGTYAATNNVATPFLLNQLTLGGVNQADGTPTITIAGSALRFTAGTAVLNLTANWPGWNRHTYYNVTAPVEFLGDFSVTGNGNESFTFSGGYALPAGATTITTTGSARATFSGGMTRSANLNFAGAGTGGITFSGTTTLASNIAVDVTGSSVPAFGQFAGTGNLTKTGAGTMVINNTTSMAGFSGNTAINGGTVRYNYSGAGPFTLDFGSGALSLDNATLHFNFGGNSWGATATVPNALTIGANGGTLNLGPDGSGQRRAAVSFTGGITLNGNLTITGDSFGNTLVSPPSLGNLTLNTSAQLSNTTSNSPATVNLGPTISGATRTLTLAGGPFQITDSTATSIDLQNLIVQAGASLALRNDGTTAAYDVLDKITANGGTTTVYGTLSLGGYSFNRTFKTANVSFQPGSRLNLLPIGGTWDSNWQINGSLTVNASGLSTLYYEPFRGFSGGLQTVNPADVITIGNGGIFSIAVYREDGGELTNAEMKFLNGATLVGYNGTNYEGGLVRGSKTLTLGDGTPSTITVQGNHGTQVDSFNLGYAANTTDSGNVTMRYANTSATAGTCFNVGWSNGGNIRAALLALKETSGGTEFAPLAGSGGVAIVGPTSGTVAAFAKTATLTTTGTVGFYNAGANNVRGALGPVAVNSGGTLNLQAAGTVQAAGVAVNGGGILSGIGTVAAPVTVAATGQVTPGNSIGTLTVSTIAFQDNGALVAEVNAAGQGDTLAVTGLLDLSASLDRLDITGALAPLGGAHYTLATWGSVTGTFGQVFFNGTPVTNPTDFHSIDGEYMLYYTPNALLLVPEPSALALLALGGLALGARRKS